MNQACSLCSRGRKLIKSLWFEIFLPRFGNKINKEKMNLKWNKYEQRKSLLILYIKHITEICLYNNVAIWNKIGSDVVYIYSRIFHSHQYWEIRIGKNLIMLLSTDISEWQVSLLQIERLTFSAWQDLNFSGPFTNRIPIPHTSNITY